jgi:hypothetical protein
MRKGQTKGEKGLNNLVYTRINDAKYKELSEILSKTKNETISSIIRKIIYDRKIRTYVHDESMDILIEELAAIRGEILVIGRNVNQMARLCNISETQQQKLFFARNGYKEYLRMESKIDRTIELIGILGKKWLSGEN